MIASVFLGAVTTCAVAAVLGLKYRSSGSGAMAVSLQAQGAPSAGMLYVLPGVGSPGVDSVTCRAAPLPTGHAVGSKHDVLARDLYSALGSGQLAINGKPIRVIRPTGWERSTDRVLTTGEMELLEQGWPFRAFRSYEDVNRGNGTVLTLNPSRPFPEGRVAWRPMWRGFALNSAIYAVAWGVLLVPVSHFFGRARRRAARGLCPVCGYDVRGSDSCTECGRGMGDGDCVEAGAPQ